MKKDYIYSATFYVSTPCAVIGCSCKTGKRYISFSYKPSKQDLIKHEPGLDRVEVEKKLNGQTIHIEAFKRLHKGVNGRKTDSFSNWFSVLRSFASYEQTGKFKIQNGYLTGDKTMEQNADTFVFMCTACHCDHVEDGGTKGEHYSIDETPQTCMECHKFRATKVVGYNTTDGLDDYEY